MACIAGHAAEVQQETGPRTVSSHRGARPFIFLPKETDPMANPFTLSPLPYDENALEPAISARTIGFHYNKHHKTYVETLNKLVEGTRYADMKLEQIVRTTVAASDPKEKKIFNNAGQVWNHDFYWRSLAPKATKPDGKLAQAIDRDFGGLDQLLKQAR
jgi:Fe-Mn family superoxide dismutase